MLRGSSGSDMTQTSHLFLQYLTSTMKSEVTSVQSAYVTDISADVLLVSISSWSRMMLGTVGMLCMYMCLSKISHTLSVHNVHKLAHNRGVRHSMYEISNFIEISRFHSRFLKISLYISGISIYCSGGSWIIMGISSPQFM